MDDTRTNYPLERYTEEMQRLLVRAQQGDLAVLPELRALINDRPELWQHAGDLAEHAELSLLRLVSGADLLALETVRRKLAELKAELAGPDCSPLEKLLVDRVGVCWLQVHHADMDAVSALSKDQGATSLSLYAQRRLDSAHRRYLTAVKQLALVRKLLRVTPAPIEVATRLNGKGPKGGTTSGRSQQTARVLRALN